MGICSRRHFLLTICILQLITTIERQVFDFLGFMWAPILVNFFNIIFVILGFFGAFQYRPKYIIVYCVWNTLWLGWNIFLICFYLSIGILDKDGDLLNLGTGSFSWWQINGPGCKASYNVTEPETEISRPVKPSNVIGCVLDFEVIEVVHASTQCLFAFMAIVAGICLSRVFLEEDDSFDFVGGGDFGLAGHTPLHPMYVSYSALSPLPPPYNNNSNSNSNTNTNSKNYNQKNNKNYSSLRTSISQRSINSRDYNKSNNKNSEILLFNSSSAAGTNKSVKNYPSVSRNDTNKSIRSNLSERKMNKNDSQGDKNRSKLNGIDYPNDYSNPLDHLYNRSISPNNDEYDSLDRGASASLKVPGKLVRYEKSSKQQNYYPHSSKYSPIVQPKLRSSSRNTAGNKQNRNSAYKPRVFTDHIREQSLRSFYSDPRLSVEQNEDEDDNSQRRVQKSRENSIRPLSLHGNNF